MSSFEESCIAFATATIDTPAEELGLSHAFSKDVTVKGQERLAHVYEHPDHKGEGAAILEMVLRGMNASPTGSVEEDDEDAPAHPDDYELYMIEKGKWETLETYFSEAGKFRAQGLSPHARELECHPEGHPPGFGGAFPRCDRCRGCLKDVCTYSSRIEDFDLCKACLLAPPDMPRTAEEEPKSNVEVVEWPEFEKPGRRDRRARLRTL